MTRVVLCGYVVVALCLHPGPGTAQSASGAATAKVLVSLALITLSDLDMGWFIPGAGTVAVNAKSPSAGKFRATGTSGYGLTVTYPGSVTLTSGVNSLSLTVSVLGNNTDNQAGSSAVPSGSTVYLGRPPRGQGQPRRVRGTDFFFWFGGTTTIGVAQPTGSYTGTFTLSVQY